MTETPSTEPGISITRVFDAPRADVWKEWTEPERFADWYGGPEGEVPLSSVSMDVRVGGEWRLTMYFGPKRREIQWRGEYRELIEPERLVFTVTDRADEAEELVIVDLIDLGDGRTEMRFQQRGGGLTEKGYERAGEGWGGFFDRMDQRLAS
jgi:uncharacterized protein YndB with AHSA1/START domain